ncbi:MAG: EAL domain-containing protein, partial [Marinobacter vinifirmus]
TVQDKTFTPWLSVALKAARLPGDALIFQFREGDANNFMKQAKEFTKAAHQLHSKVSISQFGCALDPYNTLKHIEADYVRLDGSFVEEVDKGDAGKEQLKAMVKGLQNAGKITIIPDVQHASVLALLYQAGVNFIQGNYLQAPSPAMNYDFGAG